MRVCFHSNPQFLCSMRKYFQLWIHLGKKNQKQMDLFETFTDMEILLPCPFPRNCSVFLRHCGCSWQCLLWWDRSLITASFAFHIDTESQSTPVAQCVSVGCLIVVWHLTLYCDKVSSWSIWITAGFVSCKCNYPEDPCSCSVKMSIIRGRWNRNWRMCPRK